MTLSCITSALVPEMQLKFVHLSWRLTCTSLSRLSSLAFAPRFALILSGVTSRWTKSASFPRRPDGRKCPDSSALTHLESLTGPLKKVCVDLKPPLGGAQLIGSRVINRGTPESLPPNIVSADLGDISTGSVRRVVDASEELCGSGSAEDTDR